MAKSKIIYDTLLSKLDETNYEKLIHYESLRLKGYRFHYIVDPDLIGKYCFPYGIDPKEDRLEELGLSDNYIADEQVILHLIFNSEASNTYLIILNEYIPEIKGMIFKAKIVHDDANYFSSRNRRSTNPKQYHFDLSTQIKEEYSHKIAEVLFTKKSLEKFSSLFKGQKLLYQTTEIKNDFFEDAFDFTITSKKRTEYILEKFRAVIKKNFSKRAIAKERDSSAIDRIININTFIQERGTPEQRKNIFLLIGDSETTNEVFENLKSDSEFNYPYINDQKINLYYSIQEHFAYIISSGKQVHQTGKEYIFQNLIALKEAYLRLLKGFQQTKFDKVKYPSFTIQELGTEYPQLFSNYFNQRNIFENLGLLHSRSKIYESIKEDIALMDLPELSSFFNKIKEDEKGLITNLLEERTKILDRLVTEGEINFYFVRGLDILRDTGVFGIQKGLDLIEGSYQHLPVFFKLDIFPKEIQQQFKKILNIILSHTANKGNEIYENMKEFLDKLRNTKARDEYPLSEKIIKAILCILLPMEHEVDFKERDSLVFEWLKDINEKISPKDEFKSELLYILSWCARRIELYPESISYATTGSRLFKNDPRFYHSLLLNELCLFAKEKDVNMLNPILNYTLKAESLYFDFIETHFGTSKKENIAIQKKLKDCFNNNLCFVYTDIANFTKSKRPKETEMYLVKARYHLSLLQLNGRFRESLPEYYDTEAYLLFVESFVFHDEEIKKLSLSLDLIKKSITLQKRKRNISKGLFKKYESRKLQIQERLAYYKKRVSKPRHILS